MVQYIGKGTHLPLTCPGFYSVCHACMWVGCCFVSRDFFRFPVFLPKQNQFDQMEDPHEN